MASYVDDSRMSRLDLIGQSPEFRKAVCLIERMANCSASVLLCGETGTGKELAARAIHYLSPCRHLPFIPVNCGAFPDMLVESELFGHARGAFTDARDVQVGLVAQANGGTLFLDEVDSLSLKAQIALLRFLQDGSYRPLGAGKAVTSKARIVAATNADLVELVKRGAFRSDLFYRLCVVPVRMPPLRERAGDVILLAEEFLKRSAQQHGGGPRYIDAASRPLLERYDWPGNVRELANVIQRESLLADGDWLHLAPEAIGLLEGDGASVGAMHSSFHKARARALADFERHFVHRALAESEGNVSLAAKRSGKERRSFGRLIKKHSIDKTEYARRS
jgi:two-component system, NtrC family, response regulator GlrR